MEENVKEAVATIAAIGILVTSIIYLYSLQPPVPVALGTLFLIGVILVIFNRPVKGTRRRWDRIFYVSLLGTFIVMFVIAVAVEPPLIRLLYPGPKPLWLWWRTDSIIAFLAVILPPFLFWDDVKEALEEAQDSFQERSEHIRLTKEEEVQQPVAQVQPIVQPVGQPLQQEKSWFEKVFGSEGRLLGKFLPIEIIGEFFSNFLFHLLRFSE